MKICVAQTKPVKGNIPANLENHQKCIDVAISFQADMIFFPELSITGYEPELAEELAMDYNDSRLEVLQILSDNAQLTIGVGAPIRNETGISISHIIFQPNKSRALYSKKYLHPDELPYFISGQSTVGLLGEPADTALAICYELSVPEHSENACKMGAKTYLACVAKCVTGVDKASKTLSAIARKYSMHVLMSNCIGPSDNFESAGQSAVWNNNGELVGQLDDSHEGLIVFEPHSGVFIKKFF